MNEAAALLVSIGSDNRGLNAGLAGANRSIGSFGSGVMRSMKLMTVGAGAALGALGVTATKAAVDFESSFAGVRKTVDASPKEFAALEKGIRNMAKEIPTSVHQLNEIAESAGALGVEKKSILAFTRTVADMGETTNLVGEEGAATMARFANITKMPQKEFGRLGSVIVDLGNKGASTEKEIAAMGLRLAAAGSQVGMTVPEILGMSNALSSLGLEAEGGGSAFSRFMVEVQSATSKGGEKLATFAKLSGQSADQFKKNWKDDAAGTLVEVVKGMGKFKDMGGDLFAMLDKLDLDDIRLRDAILRAAGAGDLLETSIKNGNAAWKEGNALQQEAAKRYETNASRLKVLKNRWYDLKITMGNFTMPKLSQVTKWADGVLRALDAAKGGKAKLQVGLALAAGALNAIEGQLRAAFSKLGAIAGQVDWSAAAKNMLDALGKALQTGGQLAATISKIIGGAISQGVMAIDFSALGQKLGPMLLIMIATAISALFDPAFWAANWQIMVGAAATALLAKFTILGKLPFLGPLLSGIGTQIMKMIGPIGKLAGGLVMAFVRGFMEAFPRTASAVAGLATVVLNALRGLPGKIAEVMRDVATRWGQGLGLMVIEAAKLIGRVVVAVAAGLARLAPVVWNAIKTAGAAIGNAVGTWAAAAGRLALAVLRAIIEKLLGLRSAVGAKIMEGLGAISAAAATAFAYASEIGRNIIGGIISGLAGLFTAVGSAIAGKVRGAIQWAKDNVGSTAGEYAARLITQPMGAAMIRGFLLGTTQLPEKMSEKMRASIEAMKGTVDAAGSVMASAFSRLAERALGAYDARTEQLLGKIEAKLARRLGALELQGAKLTPAELELQAMDKASREAELSGNVTDAKAALDKALGAEEQNADEIAAARRQLASALAAIDRARLEERAAAERTARDKETAAAQAAATKEYERKKLDLSAERELERTHREQALATMEAQLAKHPEKWSTMYARLRKMFASDFGPKMQTAGTNLGLAYAKGLRESFDEVEKTAKALAALIAKYLRTNSPTEKGPMSDLDRWWHGFAPALTSGLDTGAISAAATQAASGSAGGFGGGSGARAGRGPSTVHLEVHGHVLTERDLLKLIRDMMIREGRSTGGGLLGGYA